MAQVRHNVVVRGLTGMFGDQLVIRQRHDGKTVVADRPTVDPNRQATPAQLKAQQDFSDAAAYAKESQDNPAYVAIAEAQDRNPRNVAFADWFHAPEIIEIDLSAWSGAAGSIIRVKAKDDVQVKQVTLAITDAADAVLESGAATKADGFWWEYRTTTAASGTPKVIVSAEDLPGHSTKMTKSK